MTSNYLTSSGRQITSEVLLKLDPTVLPKLPLACKTCPAAMWQIVGKPEQSESVTARCYCHELHTFVWDSKTNEEILDCDRLYEPEEEEDELKEPNKQDVPPFLRNQQANASPPPSAPDEVDPDLPGDDEIPVPTAGDPETLSDELVEM